MKDPEAAIRHAQELLQLRDLEAALKDFAEAQALGADRDQCCSGRWTAFMLLGDFSSAWAESDAIQHRRAADPHRFWQGENLRGRRVILRCLHGLGDAVQFFRYVPAIRSLASSLIIEVPPPLLELAPCFAGVEEVIPWGAGAPAAPPHWDVQVEINELPYLFRTTAEELPFATNYLHLPGGSLKPMALQSSGSASLRVGMVWASGDWNPSRSVPFDLLQPILNRHDCEFWNLQGGNDRERWSQLPIAPHRHSAEASANSLPGLAATIAQLDLVITSDTLAAHLAGALGVPAWVMLERAADWRWQHARNDSPWYPTLRLFRQSRDGDWSSVITNIANELQRVSLKHGMVA